MITDFINPLYNILQERRKKGFKAYNVSVPNWSSENVKKLGLIASKYGFPPQWLANLINFESGGTFNPAVQNPSSGATGLIQFMPSFFDTKKLKQMSVSQQLDEVDKYLYNFFYKRKTALKVFDRTKKKVKSNFTQTDLFMIIFYPVSVGNPFYVFPLKVVVANNGITTPQAYTKKVMQSKLIPFPNYPTKLVDVPPTEDIMVEEENKFPTFYKILIVLGLSYIGYKVYKGFKLNEKLLKYNILKNKSL
jgi:hypothetical protein